jgi:thiamine transporter
MLAEAMAFISSIGVHGGFFMPSDNSVSSETTSEYPFVKWLKTHTWLLAAGFGLIAFLGLLGPVLSAKTVSAVEDGTLSAGSRVNVYFADIIGLGIYQANWPLILVFGLAVVAIALALFGRKHRQLLAAASLLFLICGVLLLIGNSFFDYINCLNLEGYDVVSSTSGFRNYQSLAGTNLGIGLVFPAVLVFVAALVSFIGAYDQDSISVKDMAEIGVLSALAIVLNFFPKISIGAEGGSINLASFPLLLIALRHGPVKGFIASGVIFGFITCLTDGYGLFTYPLDYLMGFGGLAVVGFFSKQIFPAEQKGYSLKGEFFLVLGVTLATLIRFIGSSASAVINYGYDLPSALIYNIVYIPLTGAVSLAILMALYGPLARINSLFPVSLPSGK